MHSFNKIKFAQNLTIGALIATTLSPPLANLLISLIILISLSSSEIREKLLNFFFSKLGLACLVFIFISLSGLVYGIESQSVILSSLWGWRKFLLLPFAAALFFNDDDARNRLIKVFFLSCIFLCIYSFLCLIFPFISYKSNFEGIVIRNSATQSLIFSVATIIGFNYFIKEKFWGRRKVLATISIILLLINIATVTTSRSSYLAIILMTFVLIFLSFRSAPVYKNIILSVAASFVVSIFLLLTPHSKNRIDIAKIEFQSAQSEPNQTSVGLRLIFWENTIKIIPKYLFPGAGVGGFAMAYAETESGKPTSAMILTGDPHNQYLKILIEQGFLGLLIFCLILYLLIQVRSDNTSKTIGVCVLTGFMLTSIFNSHFSTFNEGQFIWIFSGALLGSQFSTIKFRGLRPRQS